MRKGGSQQEGWLAGWLAEQKKEEKGVPLPII